MNRSIARALAVTTALLALAGCATAPYAIDDTFRAKNVDSRVQFLVLHYTSSDFNSSLATLIREGGTNVSSHYLVRDDPPSIYRLVEEDKRSWHAGQSSWLGYTQLNGNSIGIEIVNRGEVGGRNSGIWEEYPKAQMDLVIALSKDIIKRHNIKPERVVGHSDIAPQRKVDPGPAFPWKRFADEGLILWPDEAEVARRLPAFEAQVPDVVWFQDRLAKHGFSVPQDGALDERTVRVISAFQMKYRPKRYDGMPDAETAALLDVLTGP